MTISTTREVGVLDGVKVLDVASFIFGPACAATMADFGADVIKVEAPGIGDPYRYVHKSLPFPPSELDYLFQQDNRSKRGVVVNLNVESGREVFMRLVAWADVVITNFPPRVLASLRIRYEDLIDEHPNLIYAQVTGFGEAGAEMDNPGYDATAYWARTGLMDAVRPKDAEPAVSLGGMGDHPSALALLSGVMLALYRRERTGKGCKVSSNLMANGAWAGVGDDGRRVGRRTAVPAHRSHCAAECAGEQLRHARRALDSACGGAAGKGLPAGDEGAGPRRPDRRSALRRSCRAARRMRRRWRS